jgi:His-Xaa-Ser system protein HxsD
MAGCDEGGNTKASVEVDTKFCPFASVQKAAYEFSNRASVNIDSAGNARLLVTLVSTSGNASLLLGQFKARMADLALQETINEQTRTIRDALVTAAMWESLPRKAS